MKDKCIAAPIAEFVGLRPEMYSILKADGLEERKDKGVKKAVVKKHISHAQYKEALFEGKCFRQCMDMLRSREHQILSEHVNKTLLSPLDTKRWIAADGISTLAYGHREASAQVNITLE